MGSIFQRTGDPCYSVKYKRLDGSWRAVRTKHTDLPSATARLAELEAAVAAERAAAPRDPDGMVYTAPTVGELLEWYALQHRRGGHSVSTLASLQLRIREDAIGARIAREVRAQDVAAWLARLRAQQLAASTCNWLRGLLGAAYNTARRMSWPSEGHFVRNPAYAAYRVTDYAQPAAARRLDYPVLRAAQVAPFIAALPQQHRAMFATAIYMGMRLGELIRLRHEDVDLQRMRITIRKAKTARGIRSIPIPTELAPWLAACIAEAKERWPGDATHSGCEWVFHTPQGQQRARATNWSSILRGAIERAGLDVGARGTRMRFHDLRHTTASLLIEAGATLAEVAAYLGDRMAVVERVYVHLSKDHLAGVAAKLEGRFGLGQAAVQAPVAPAPQPVQTRYLRTSPGVFDFRLADGKGGGVVTADGTVLMYAS